MSDKPTGLALLREPFPQNLIGKLPKPTKAQTEALKADFKRGSRCALCGGWHQAEVVHLDYVGHAALTDRLLDADLAWTWEPLAMTTDGLPVLDPSGGMWIKLTVCGVTRLGYGHAEGKEGGNAIKEVIGDALRNAAMRFGAALDLWHKGDLHADEPKDDAPVVAEPVTPPAPIQWPAEAFAGQFPRWEKAVAAGMKTTDDILALARSKGPLTRQQEKDIQAIKSAIGATYGDNTPPTGDPE